MKNDHVRDQIASSVHQAEEDFIQGSVEARLESWSHSDPVSVFAALGPSKTGWSELEPMFRAVADRLAGGRDLSFDIVAFEATETLAWSAGFLRFTVSIDGAPAAPRTLRITHVYRREGGAWKIAHEHSNWEP